MVIVYHQDCTTPGPDRHVLCALLFCFTHRTITVSVVILLVPSPVWSCCSVPEHLRVFRYCDLPFGKTLIVAKPTTFRDDLVKAGNSYADLAPLHGFLYFSTAASTKLPRTSAVFSGLDFCSSATAAG